MFKKKIYLLIINYDNQTENRNSGNYFRVIIMILNQLRLNYFKYTIYKNNLFFVVIKSLVKKIGKNQIF